MSFDRVASYYDRLAQFVFGNGWNAVQLAPLKYIRPSDEVLILGGGTGKMLESVVAKHITFLDISEQMLLQAKARTLRSPVSFCEHDFLEWQDNQRYDVIVAPFFLDVFTETELISAISKIKSRLNEEGKLVIVDFQKANWWRNLVVKLMILYFRMTAELKADRLMSLSEITKESGFMEIHKRSLLSGWIFCGVYELN